jgi:hypothetical protein
MPGYGTGPSRAARASERYQQRREERPGAEPRDPQLQVPRRRGHRPLAVPIPQAGPGLSALVRVRADHRRELGFDQRLVDRLGRLPDPVIDLGGFEYFQDFEQGRLVQGHRVRVLPREPLAWSR